MRAHVTQEFSLARMMGAIDLLGRAARMMKTPWRAQATLAGAYFALLGLVAVLNHSPGIAKPMYLAAAVCTAAITRRLSPWLYFTGMMWFWLGSSFARRLMNGIPVSTPRAWC